MPFEAYAAEVFREENPAYYLNHPAAASDFSDLYYGDTYEADTAQPFPMLEGQIPYTVSEP